MIRLVEPTSGRVDLDGQDILSLAPKDMREARSNIQMVFQDPFASLNPQMLLVDQVAEPLRNYGTLRGKDLEERIEVLFDRVKYRVVLCAVILMNFRRSTSKNSYSTCISLTLSLLLLTKL